MTTSTNIPCLNIKVFYLFAFALIVGLLLFYVIQVNQMISDKYLIESYERKMSVISEQNKNLEEQLSHLVFLENIETLIEGLNYEKVGRVYYIEMLESSVVSK